MIVKPEDLYIHTVDDLLKWMGEHGYVREIHGGFSKHDAGIVVYSPPDLDYILKELQRAFEYVAQYYPGEDVEYIIKDVVFDRMYGYMIYSRG